MGISKDGARHLNRRYDAQNARRPGGIPIIQLRHQAGRDRPQERERPVPRLFAIGSRRYRKRLLIIIACTAAIWAVLYLLARILFF
jgi:hypothetical protein